MAPTRKNTMKHSMTRKAPRLARYNVTYHDLHKWKEAEFEKLGWMVLAKAKGMNYKIDVYKKSIDHLIKSIKHVSAEYEEADRKHDLNVLLMQVECLKDTVSKIF